MKTDSVYNREEGILIVSRDFRARSEEVFDAWVQPEKVKEWWWECVDCKLLRSEIQARRGGVFNHYYVSDDEYTDNIVVSASISECIPASRLVYEYAVPYDGDNEHTQVDVHFIKLESGKTRVTLSQSGLATMMLIRSIICRSGIEVIPGNPLVIQKKWEQAFDKLAAFLETEDAE